MEDKKTVWKKFKSFFGIVTNKDLKELIIMNQKEEAAALTALTAQLAKANKEIQDKIAALQAAVDNGPDVSPEVEVALNNLTSATQSLDDIVPDPVIPPPTTP